MELGFDKMELVGSSMLGVGPKLNAIWTNLLEVVLKVRALLYEARTLATSRWRASLMRMGRTFCSGCWERAIRRAPARWDW